nr:lymphocyte antigen 75 [Hymenolepis microstoma]
MYLCYLYSLTILLVGEALTADCPDGFFRISNSCYFIYNNSREVYTWTEAREECKKLHPNADLLEIHDQTTQEYLNVVISLLSWPLWIGLRRNTTGISEHVDSYRWLSSDRPLTYANWAIRTSSDLASLSELQCVYLSTASLRVGDWERTDCSATRMGFGCEVPLDASNVVVSPLLRKGVKPIWNQPENSQGQICYLGTCYSLRHSTSNRENYEEAKLACGKEAVALPRNPLEVSFIRTLLRHRTNATQAWVGIEVTHSKDRLVFPRIAAVTPWLTAAIHKSHPGFSDPYSLSEPEKVCFVLDAIGNTSRPPFDRGACYEDEEDSWEGDKEGYYDHMEEDEDVHKSTAFCTTPMTSTVGVCPEMNGHDGIVDWQLFGDKCYAVMSGCGGESVPASVKSADIDIFINWLLPGDVTDEGILIGGIVNETHPLSITWQDGSIGGDFHRLKPTSLRINGSSNGLCLAIEPQTGWWKLVDCKGPRAPRWTLCSTPVRAINPELTTLPSEPTEKKVSCPTDYMELKHRDGSVRCYRVRHGGLRSHGHDWRMAERACRRVVSVTGQKNRWEGHLASIANETISQEIISLLQGNGYAVGISEIGNNLPVHMLKPSELVWIGLSKSHNKLFWNNWTDGCEGDSEFYENRVRQEESIFTDTNSNFFDHGSCIALHLPSGSWYALRCTLDLGYLCQATPTSESQSDSSSADHFDSPKCLLASSTQEVPSPETGFIQDPDFNCVSEGFTYFNGQCFRVIHDKFMSFTEAQSYCHELGSRYSKNGEAGLAIYRSEADQLFVASQLSHLPKLPLSPKTYGRGSESYTRLEVIWRRYHWVGMFLYRHAFHEVDERVPCYIAHELNRPLSSSVDGPLCVSVKGVPDTEHFGSLSLEMGCEERLPFVCSFEPSRAHLVAKASSPVCPRGYATHHAITGDHCYLFMTNYSGTYEEAESMCAQTAPGARLAALSTPYTVAWMRAHLPSDHTQSGMLPWESVPHWIGLKVPAHCRSTWRWSNGLPVTHTRWSTPPTSIVDSDVDTCFAFSKSISMTSYELDMVAMNCTWRLSPLCETDPITSNHKSDIRVDENLYEMYHGSDQRDYVGRTMFSESRKLCIRWDLIKPTNRSELEALQRAFHNAVLLAVSEVLEPGSFIPEYVNSLAFQPVFSASSNWCRNPSGLRDRAFCYISVNQWEYCQLPELYSGHGSMKYPEFHEILERLLRAIGVIFIPLLIVGLCLGLIICYCRKSRRGRSSSHAFQEMILRRVPFSWRWRRGGSQSCLLAESVSYSVGTAMISDSTANLVTSDPKA